MAILSYGNQASIIIIRRVSAKRPLVPNLYRLVKKKGVIHGHLLSRYDDQVPF